jgi:hypothetical protein
MDGEDSEELYEGLSNDGLIQIDLEEEVENDDVIDSSMVDDEELALAAPL